MDDDSQLDDSQGPLDQDKTEDIRYAPFAERIPTDDEASPANQQQLGPGQAELVEGRALRGGEPVAQPGVIPTAERMGVRAVDTDQGSDRDRDLLGSSALQQSMGQPEEYRERNPMRAFPVLNPANPQLARRSGTPLAHRQPDRVPRFYPRPAVNQQSSARPRSEAPVRAQVSPGQGERHGRNSDPLARLRPEYRVPTHNILLDLKRITAQSAARVHYIHGERRSEPEVVPARNRRVPGTAEIDLDVARLVAPMKEDQNGVRQSLLALIAPGVSAVQQGDLMRFGGDEGEVYGLVELRWPSGGRSESVLLLTPLGDGRRNDKNAVYAFLSGNTAAELGRGEPDNPRDPTAANGVSRRHAVVTARALDANGQTMSKVKISDLSHNGTTVLAFNGPNHARDVQFGEEGWTLSEKAVASAIQQTKWGGDSMTTTAGYVSPAYAKAWIPRGEPDARRRPQSGSSGEDQVDKDIKEYHRVNEKRFGPQGQPGQTPPRWWQRGRK